MTPWRCEPRLLDISQPSLGQVRGIGPMNQSRAGGKAADGCRCSSAGGVGASIHARIFAPNPPNPCALPRLRTEVVDVHPMRR